MNSILNGDDSKEFGDVGEKKIWERMCPNCGEKHTYSRKYKWKIATEKNKMCFLCTIKSEKHRDKVQNSLKGRKISDTHKKHISDGMRGRKITWGDKISRSLTGRTIQKVHDIKRLESRLGMDYDIWCKTKPEFFHYKSRVMSITRRQPITNLINSDKIRGLAGTNNGHQLDHIISIKDGFVNNINPFIIGNVRNLRIITWEENLKKNKNSDKNLLDHVKNNQFPITEKELNISKYNPKLYKILTKITDAWFDNPNLTREEALSIANGLK